MWSVKRIVPLVLVGVILALPAVWFFTRDTLPDEIVIATGREGGMYYRLGETLGALIEERTGRPVKVVETNGSVENRRLLDEKKAHFAFLQSGSFELAGLSIITPLYNEPAVIIARTGSGIETVYDLEGKAVCVGPPGSGMLKTSEAILGFYGLGCEDVCEAFTEECFEAAIVTTGILNESLIEILDSGRYDVMGLEEAEALAETSGHLGVFTLPRGIFSRNPARPKEPIKTVAATALLTARGDVSPVLVETVLEAINETDLILRFPPLFGRSEVAEWERFPLHRRAQQYYNPNERIGILANWMESLAATKELIFAILAAGYFLWLQLRRLQRKKHEGQLQEMKDRLDSFLDKATLIDRRQLVTEDIDELESLIDEVTHIKLTALEELTGEDLRGNNMFSIFLLQCTSIISKIQAKVDRAIARKTHEDARAGTDANPGGSQMASGSEEASEGEDEAGGEDSDCPGE